MFLCFYTNCEESAVEDLPERIHNLNLWVFQQCYIKEYVEEKKNESLRIISIHCWLWKRKEHFKDLRLLSYCLFSFCWFEILMSL